MPAKPTFSDDQVSILLGVIRRAQKRFKNQTELAKALGLTQPSLSSLLAGKWAPGLTTARYIAQLESVDLEELLPDFRAPASSMPPEAERPNLEKCLMWHEDEHRWSDWTVAAAKAGIFGPTDFSKSDWVTKLDGIEKALERVRKVG